jgi:hypothetical protein
MSGYHYLADEPIISEEDQAAFLVAVYGMALTNHMGCINLLLKLANIQKPCDWDNHRVKKSPNRQHGYPARREIESEADVIHYLCVAD